MKKKSLFILLVIGVLLYAPTVLGAQIEGSHGVGSSHTEVQTEDSHEGGSSHTEISNNSTKNLTVTTNGCTNILGSNTILDPKIPNAVHTIILVIQIAVPILLVIFGMLDLFKGITAQKEDEIKKGQQIFIKRLISAAIIFFVIAIVKLLFGFVTSDNPTESQNTWTCINCFLNGVNKDGKCK